MWRGTFRIPSTRACASFLTGRHDCPAAGQVRDFIQRPLLGCQLLADRRHPLQASYGVARSLMFAKLSREDAPETPHGMTVRVPPIMGNRKDAANVIGRLVGPNEFVPQRLSGVSYILHAVCEWWEIGHGVKKPERFYHSIAKRAP